MKKIFKTILEFFAMLLVACLIVYIASLVFGKHEHDSNCKHGEHKHDSHDEYSEHGDIK